MSVWSILYWLTLVTVLVSRLFPSLASAEYFSKPLLMPFLIMMLLSQVETKTKLVWLLVLSLLFSLCGDCFLMFSGMHFFAAGLGSFLLAHICYIYLFLKSGDRSPGHLIQTPIKALPFALYGIGLIALLWTSLGVLKIPVMLYSASILGMALTALERGGRVSSSSFRMVFIGALLFLLSDSMIAINRFYQAIPLADIWIMITYGLAQFLIVSGMILWFNRSRKQ